MSDTRSRLNLRNAPWAPALIALLMGCAQQTTTRAMPYIAPPWAAKQAMLNWTEDDVLACFGQATGSDTIAGWRRFLHERQGCRVYFQFEDGNVHAAEGMWGTEQACWWTVEACDRGAPDVTRDSWRRWTINEVVACFGEPKERVATSGAPAMRVERDGCTMDVVLDRQQRLLIHHWTADCPTLIARCAANS